MILCVGTTPVLQRTMLFASLKLDAVNRATEVHQTASGKSINVARVLHTLGHEVTATGFLGGGSGQFIRADLTTGGIAHDFIEVAPSTRMCVTVMDQSTRHATELVEESTEVAPNDFDLLRQKISSLLPRASLIVLSGSLPPRAPQDFYAWCIDAAHLHKIRAILDASGEPLRAALVSHPFVVKPNRAELAATLDCSIDSDAALRDAIKRLIDLGPRWAVVTMGKDGAIASDGRQFLRLHSPKVEAINPIGSGDSLAAGIAAGLFRGQEMPEACKLGIACGAANAMTKTAGVVRVEDVHRLLELVGVESW